MEDRTKVRERHGVANARKVTVASAENSDVQAVTVVDGADGEVILVLSSPHPAGMTPKQARMLAGQLIQSAARVEA